MALKDKKVENEEIENEKIKNEKNVMNYSSVSTDSQPSPADVIAHLIIIYNDNNDMIQQSFSSASVLKSSHYSL